MMLLFVGVVGTVSARVYDFVVNVGQTYRWYVYYEDSLEPAENVNFSYVFDGEQTREEEPFTMREIGRGYYEVTFHYPGFYEITLTKGIYGAVAYVTVIEDGGVMRVVNECRIGLSCR